MKKRIEEQKKKKDLLSAHELEYGAEQVRMLN